MPLQKLTLESEPYGRSGNIGTNLRKLLGAPALDPLQTLLREAIQNSCDAAKLGAGPEILVRVRALTAEQIAVMRTIVLAELPEEDESHARLERFRDGDEHLVLEICDFNTTGLGGPTRADRMPADTTRTDFIDFIRNIGTPRDTENGGGTYGFGKVALYAASRANTILVDTWVAEESENQRRLVGSHIGTSFSQDEGGYLRQYTGRHWWGRSEGEDDFAEPLTGPDATGLADALGFPHRDESRTGTSIMILDFEPGEEQRSVLGGRIVESLLWNFWPRMMQTVEDARRVTFTVEVDGAPVEVPRPEFFPPLDLFCKALADARRGEGQDCRSIGTERPRRFLGNLALRRGGRGRRIPLVPNESLFPHTASHIAVMRPVELVVKYFQFEQIPDGNKEWVGVFRADEDEEVERAFADAEPPAHDDWVPDNLPKGHISKTFVTKALKEIKQAGREVTNPGASDLGGGGNGPPLARVAGIMGSALFDTNGDGAGPSRADPTGGAGARPRQAQVTKPVFRQLIASEEGRTAVFTVEVRQDLKATGKVLKALPSLALEGGKVSEEYFVEDPPRVVSVRSADGTHAVNSDELELDGAEGVFEILISMPDDYAATVEAVLLRGE